jgi:precorrin-3B C17-methyltransferase
LPSHNKTSGKLYIVGSGPGNLEQMTEKAKNALLASDYIIGNDTYLVPLMPLIGDRTVIKSSMGKEVERAQRSIELAESSVVSIVSGGDPGVYGMAGIVLEVLEKSGKEIDVEVIPGVTAANAAASLLGSPLSGDFAVISLSDLLVPIEVIEKRLNASFSMEIPVVLYNPKSRGRPHNLALAIEIARKYRDDATPVGVVKNAYREGEETIVTTLGTIETIYEQVDMHSAVIIGGSESRIWRMGNNVKGIITPRGYHRKYVY